MTNNNKKKSSGSLLILPQATVFHFWLFLCVIVTLFVNY